MSCCSYDNTTGQDLPGIQIIQATSGNADRKRVPLAPGKAAATAAPSLGRHRGQSGFVGRRSAQPRSPGAGRSAIIGADGTVAETSTTGPGSVICTGAKIGMEEDARRDLVPASDHANRCAELRCLVDDPLLLRLAEPAAPGRAGGRTRHR